MKGNNNMLKLNRGFNDNILITGVTGFIGRHVLYELINDFLQFNYSGEIILLIRGNSRADSFKRLKAILEHEYIPDYLRKFTLDDMLRNIKIIDGALGDDDLYDKINNSITNEKKLYVIHCAGSVNLFNNENAKSEIINNNFNGTQKLLDVLNNYTFKFTFISTAFSCGIVDGEIENDYSSYYGKSDFRNHYEQYKNTIEKIVIDYCSSRLIEYQILRPSVVVGRLIDTPLYYTSKFDVIYGWTKFFWHIRNNVGEDTIRIQMENTSKINVVPVDYVAKVIKNVFDSDIQFLNIVYPRSTVNRYMYGQMLKAIDLDKFVFVDDLPINLNKHEKFYYRLTHKVYSPYLNNIKNEYDTSYLKEIMDDDYIKEIDFINLAKFAIEHDFDDSKLSRV
ncbi:MULTISPECIES: SDR family oxidoreductase [Clostridium]|nr:MULTISPECIES: SDR family oxidoreductase [Clostridium]PSM55321.1 hypothetical protein C4L39_23585 [Clostridium diolis]QES74618.1 NAD-dependent epimerase/dehydratase family protein [Clostridium diolis]